MRRNEISSKDIGSGEEKMPGGDIQPRQMQRTVLRRGGRERRRRVDGSEVVVLTRIEETIFVDCPRRHHTYDFPRRKYVN